MVPQARTIRLSVAGANWEALYLYLLDTCGLSKCINPLAIIIRLVIDNHLTVSITFGPLDLWDLRTSREKGYDSRRETLSLFIVLH